MSIWKQLWRMMFRQWLGETGPDKNYTRSAMRRAARIAQNGQRKK